MTLNIHIMTLGIDKKGELDRERITSIFNKGFPPIDTIHILHSSDFKEKDEVVGDVKIVYHNLTDKLDYLGVLERIIDIYKSSEKDSHFFVNITGGTKPMSLGAFLGAVYIGAKVYYTPIDEKDYTEITPPLIPPLELSDLQKSILRVLELQQKKVVKLRDRAAGEGLTQSEILRELKKDRKTLSIQVINYNCNTLERAGYIDFIPDPSDRRKRQCVLSSRGVMACHLF